MGACGLELFPDAARELRRPLVARTEALARRAERDERTVRLAGAAGQLRDAVVDLLALSPDALEPSFRLVGGRSLDRCEQRVRVSRALDREPALGRGVAGLRGGGMRGILERPQRLVGAGVLRPLRLDEVLAQPPDERGDGLAAHDQALTGALQAIERTEGGLARAGGVGQLDLGALTLREHRREALLRRRPGEPLPCGVPPPRHVAHRATPGRAGRRGHGERRSRRRASPPLGRRRLQCQWAEALAHLLLDVAGPVDLRRDARELQLGPVPTPLELAEAGGLLDQRTPVGRLRRQDGVDLALTDDRMHRAAEPDVGEQLDEIGATHGARLTRYCPSPPRASRRAIEISLKSSSPPKPPSSLSNTSSTSQWSADGRFDEPAKRTSSGFSARSSEGVSDPAAQTIASDTLDFPEPFGPTTTATPGSRLTSTRSGND